MIFNFLVGQEECSGVIVLHVCLFSVPLVSLEGGLGYTQRRRRYTRRGEGTHVCTLAMSRLETAGACGCRALLLVFKKELGRALILDFASSEHHFHVCFVLDPGGEANESAVHSTNPGAMP